MVDKLVMKFKNEIESQFDLSLKSNNKIYYYLLLSTRGINSSILDYSLHIYFEIFRLRLTCFSPVFQEKVHFLLSDIYFFMFKMEVKRNIKKNILVYRIAKLLDNCW